MSGGYVLLGVVPLVLNGNPAPAPGNVNNDYLRIVGKDGDYPEILLDSFGVQPLFYSRRANGSNALKTALLLNDIIFQISCRGYGATGYSTGGRAEVVSAAAENWSDSAQGTYLRFFHTPSGGTTLTEVVRMGNQLRDGWNSGVEILASPGNPYAALIFSAQGTAQWSAIVWTESTLGNSPNQQCAQLRVVPITATKADMQFATNDAIGTNPPTIRMTIKNDGSIVFTQFLEGPEISDPVAPAANSGRLYFRDNGSGKTQLVARFPTGAVQVIATEP